MKMPKGLRLEGDLYFCRNCGGPVKLIKHTSNKLVCPNCRQMWRKTLKGIYRHVRAPSKGYQDSRIRLLMGK